jgi:hypothetical protein
MMSHMTAELSDGTEIKNIHDVVEGSNGVHLKKEVGSGGLERVAYIPYPNLLYVYHDN